MNNTATATANDNDNTVIIIIEAQFYHNMSTIQYICKDYKDALKYMKLAYDIHEKINHLFTIQTKPEY